MFCISYIFAAVILFRASVNGHRSERYLVFPTPIPPTSTKVQLIMGLGLPMEVDVSMIIGYVMKFNYVLPYNSSYLTQSYVSNYARSSDRARHYSERKKFSDLVQSGEITSRWQIYRLIESALENFRVSGKACLLKTVCHLAEVPFEIWRSGLFPELVHALLTPSTTGDKYETAGDQEYRWAEAAGKRDPANCVNLFPDCHHDPLEYFTEIR